MTSSRIPSVDNASPPSLQDRLCTAAKSSSKELLSLLEQNADPNIPDRETKLTPLMLAARHGKFAAIRPLIENGAEPNRTTQKGRTALHIACRRGAAISVAQLISGGADPFHASKMNTIPLHEVAFSGDVGCAQALMDSVDPQRLADMLDRQENHHGDTPLHVASRLGKHELVTLLLRHGAQQGLENNKGKRAKDLSTSLEVDRAFAEASSLPHGNSAEEAERSSSAASLNASSPIPLVGSFDIPGAIHTPPANRGRVASFSSQFLQKNAISPPPPVVFPLMNTMSSISSLDILSVQGGKPPERPQGEELERARNSSYLGRHRNTAPALAGGQASQSVLAGSHSDALSRHSANIGNDSAPQAVLARVHSVALSLHRANIAAAHERHRAALEKVHGRHTEKMCAAMKNFGGATGI